MSTCSNGIVERMNKGVSLGALAQFDKHSTEHSLQRISGQAIHACRDVGKLRETDLPELHRPWFAEDHNKVPSPLLVAVSWMTSATLWFAVAKHLCHGSSFFVGSFCR